MNARSPYVALVLSVDSLCQPLAEGTFEFRGHKIVFPSMLPGSVTRITATGGHAPSR